MEKNHYFSAKAIFWEQKPAAKIEKK